MMNNTLARLIDIERGKWVKIASYDGEPRFLTMLNKFGLYPGDLARVIRFAPFDGPVLLEVRGMEIALGKTLAARILVEDPECDSH